MFTSGQGKCRTAIVIPNNAIDALLITQMSDNEAVFLEIDNGHTNFYGASIYMD
jgi:hypothetical protein